MAMDDSDDESSDGDGSAALTELVGKRHVQTLLALCAEGYRLLQQQQCAEAIQVFEALPRAHYDTAWVLGCVGTAHAQMACYPDACEAFRALRRRDPYRVETMDVFSTVLWHLGREVELSHLAQTLVSHARLKPQTWCALGNCFSLQKDHETALRYFRRAVQLDPDFAYGYTLAGHEHAATEDFDKALACFRQAIRANARHYNAWYGLGVLFYRQEKLQIARYHFERALQINPRSSVLLCYLGIVMMDARQLPQALAMLEQAVAIDPKNPLARFKRATVLLSLGQLQPALSELQSLAEVAPKEAAIFYLMGKAYKRLGMEDLAVAAFSTALDLDPKSSAAVKQALESLRRADDESTDEQWIQSILANSDAATGM